MDLPQTNIDFAIQEAGCLIYCADRNLGENPFTDFFCTKPGLEQLTRDGAIMAMSLYQDDGFSVRVRFGELNEEEKSQWTSKVSWKLNLASGRMVVSGVCDEDLEEDVEDFGRGEPGGEYELGCFVEVPPGIYRAEVYSYPPNDLAGGWMRIEDPSLFKTCFGEKAGLEYENAVAYFERTHRGEAPPVWLEKGYEDALFLDFVIRLAPFSEEPEPPATEPDGCLLWEYRKPPVCPVGIRI